MTPEGERYPRNFSVAWRIWRLLCLLKRSFHEERFDRERGEELFGFGYVGDRFDAVSGKETGIGVFGDAGAGDQIAACQQIDHAAQFFSESIRR